MFINLGSKLHHQLHTTVNQEGQGPAWANSLFEDNAEYGFGMSLAVKANKRKIS